MVRSVRFIGCVLLALLMSAPALAAEADLIGVEGIGRTLIGLSNEQVYEAFDRPSFVEAGEDGQVFNFMEWEAYSVTNPIEQGNDGIIDVKNKVIIKYYIGYTPDYSRGRFTPGFLVSQYRVEADKYIRLEDLPLYCSDTVAIVKALSVYVQPTELRSLGAQIIGSLITYVVDSDALTKVFGMAYSGKRIAISVRVLDGEALGYPGERLVDSYHVRVVDDEEIGRLGERVDQ